VWPEIWEQIVIIHASMHVHEKEEWSECGSVEGSHTSIGTRALGITLSKKQKQKNINNEMN
jgi:hypothetical protein